MNHFNISEFDCKHCGSNKMKESFLYKIDAARHIAGIPFVITSGYRCAEHNKAVGGTNDSAHVYGYAADIYIPDSYHRYKAIYGLINAGFTRIGIGKDFIHADNDPNKPGFVVWVY